MPFMTKSPAAAGLFYAEKIFSTWGRLPAAMGTFQHHLDRGRMPLPQKQR
jgi:hypothetical protein